MILKLAIILFNSFLILWITEFVDTGIIASENDAKDLYRNYNIISVGLSVFFFPLCGYLVDTFKFKVAIPIAFLWRGLSISCFLYITDPSSWQAYIFCVCMLLGTTFETIACDALFNKNLPSDVRGTLNSVYLLFGIIGMMIFAKIGGYLFDQVSSTAPFKLVAVADYTFAAFVVMMGQMGILDQ